MLEILRKKPNALRFTKLQTTPAQTYFDIENVRTKDDALLVIRLMIFYSITDVERMLDSTKDPVADMINSVSSDVIEFTSVLTFESFKDSADKLNSLEVYKNLTGRARQMGFNVTKVVFRGFIAPPRLHKMHDDAIERRTRLVLEGESEVQEQGMKDDRLERQEVRDRRKHAMEAGEASHRLQLQRVRFEAEQDEQQMRKEQDTTLTQQRWARELDHLTKMQSALKISPQAMAGVLVAREHGAPGKLVQITGGEPATLHLQD